MKTEWVRGLNDEDKKILRERLASHKRTLDDLSRIVEGLRDPGSVTDFDLPNWDYREAHRQGWNRALDRVLGLLEI